MEREVDPDDPLGIGAEQERERDEWEARPRFVRYEPDACPNCARMRWQLLTDGSHECDKCGFPWERR